ncbi:MAG: hypothetical protein WB005_22630, partial [Pseudolabrys sp.]
MDVISLRKAALNPIPVRRPAAIADNLATDGPFQILQISATRQHAIGLIGIGRPFVCRKPRILVRPESYLG